MRDGGPEQSEEIAKTETRSPKAAWSRNGGGTAAAVLASFASQLWDRKVHPTKASQQEFLATCLDVDLEKKVKHAQWHKYTRKRGHQTTPPIYEWPPKDMIATSTMDNTADSDSE